MSGPLLGSLATAICRASLCSSFQTAVRLPSLTSALIELLTCRNKIPMSGGVAFPPALTAGALGAARPPASTADAAARVTVRRLKMTVILQVVR
jgi:hypothetical protein